MPSSINNPREGTVTACGEIAAEERWAPTDQK